MRWSLNLRLAPSAQFSNTTSQPTSGLRRLLCPLACLVLSASDSHRLPLSQSIRQPIPAQPLDAITAFAVPDPNFSSQSRRFFQVWLLSESPRRADHSAYFGLAKYYLEQVCSYSNLSKNIQIGRWCALAGSHLVTFITRTGFTTQTLA